MGETTLRAAPHDARARKRHVVMRTPSAWLTALPIAAAVAPPCTRRADRGIAVGFDELHLLCRHLAEPQDRVAVPIDEAMPCPSNRTCSFSVQLNRLDDAASSWLRAPSG